MIEAVVFDLDGVLIDSEPVWEQVRRQLVAEHGGYWAPDAQRRLMGMNTQEWSRYLSEDLGVGLPPEKVAATVIELMADRYADHLPLMPGAVETVRTLAPRWPLGLASSSSPSLIDVFLDASSLRNSFTAAMSTQEVAQGKPAPDIYAAVAAQLGRQPERCAAVEDSSNGLRSATSAGLQVIAIPHPAYPPDPDALQAARLVLTSLAELTPGTIAALGESALAAAGRGELEKRLAGGAEVVAGGFQGHGEGAGFGHAG
jgi:HAD superfamily hydrolase (TIGR01509 family)